MGMDVQAVVVAGVPAVALVVALTEVVKQVSGPDLEPRWYPLIAMGWALALAGLGGAFQETAWFQSLVGGLVVGLAAIGMFSGVRAALGGSR
jgi:hypothetical protein